MSNAKVNDATTPGDYFGAAATAGTIPRGRYPKVPVQSIDAVSPSSSQGHSQIREIVTTPPEIPRRGSGGSTSANEQWEAEERRRRFNTARRGSGTRSTSPASPASASSAVSINLHGKTPESLVAAGIARRKAGDLPKSAWLFMKAAEAGSTTGRIHYGLALRHGLGVARDDRRAFSELLLACDRSLAEGGVDLRATAGSMILTSQQRKSMAPDTSLALVEVGNCYIQGLGVKRNPDMAIEYLRMAGSLGDMAAMEQLGYILSKGLNGVKKDMREAAKWYRAALAAGSNIPGLAWVWKDKYNA
jgi:TPR repeat protein